MEAATNIDLAYMAWKTGLIPNLIKLGIITAILLVIFSFIAYTGTVSEISTNWPRYRCAPFIMPFAQLYGYDPNENFKFCVQKIFKDETKQAIAPMYGLMGNYTGTMGIMVESMNGFRKMLGNFKLSTDSYIGRVMGQVRALMFQIRLSFMKMQTLMGRVFGTMYSIIWMGTSAITAGMNLADNDLVNFMFEFCFAPWTAVMLADGQRKEMKDVVVGDVLEGGVRVSSVLRFDGSRTPMVRIGEDVVSEQHYVMHPTSGTWIPAHLHPSALPTASLSEIVCLNVAAPHMFKTAAGLVVADYDETEERGAIQGAMAIAEGALNGYSGSGSSSSSSGIDYSLGIDPLAEIAMEDSSWRRLESVKLGDRLLGGAAVLGLVEEDCKEVVYVEGLRLSAAQLVWSPAANRWQRAAGSQCSRGNGGLFRQVCTDRAGPLAVRRSRTGTVVWTRDYREAPLPEMEEPYAASLAASTSHNFLQSVSSAIMTAA